MDEEDVKNYINSLDDENIDELLSSLTNIGNERRLFEQTEEAIKNKIKTLMKIKRWNRYLDKKTRVSVTLTIQKREIINKEEVKSLLSEGQYALVSRITTYEKLSIITPETRKRLKKYVNKRTSK